MSKMMAQNQLNVRYAELRHGCINVHAVQCTRVVLHAVASISRIAAATVFGIALASLEAKNFPKSISAATSISLKMFSRQK